MGRFAQLERAQAVSAGTLLPNLLPTSSAMCTWPRCASGPNGGASVPLRTLRKRRDRQCDHDCFAMV